LSKENKRKDWIDLANKELKSKKLEDHYWNTPEGIKVKPLYTEEDLKIIKRALDEAKKGMEDRFKNKFVKAKITFD